MTRPAQTIVMLLLVLLAASAVSAQMSEKDVRARLDDIYAGKASDVRAELPQLLQKYPQDPGVLYLQAVLTTDGTAAVKRYEEIVKTYPKSAWADDALYKVYQYDFSTGLYKKADSVMAQLRADYPASIYAASAMAGDEKKSEAPAARSTTAPAVKTDESVKRPAAPVQTKTEETVKPAAARAKSGVAGGGYDVQAGVFSSEANARSAAGRLGVVSGREARVKPKTSGERTVYLVVFEGFETAESARRFSTELRTKHNIDSFVNPR